MKVFGIALFLSGILFLIYILTIDISQSSPSAGFAPWAGVIVLATGGFLFFKARKE